ncbi:formate dehydrogenase subunit delta [Thiobacillus sp.]
MNIDHLIHMANQIGTYFESEPDRTVASAGIADHLARFWEKRMRLSLYAYLDSAQNSTLAPLVSEALTQHRDQVLGKIQ